MTKGEKSFMMMKPGVCHLSEATSGDGRRVGRLQTGQGPGGEGDEGGLELAAESVSRPGQYR